MNINTAFTRKTPARKLPGGVTAEQAADIERRFDDLIRPVGNRANLYFADFSVNGKARSWLLPTECWQDLPIEKKAYVLKYPGWFVSEIKKVEPDELPFL